MHILLLETDLKRCFLADELELIVHGNYRELTLYAVLTAS